MARVEYIHISPDPTGRPAVRPVCLCIEAFHARSVLCDRCVVPSCQCAIDRSIPPATVSAGSNSSVVKAMITHIPSPEPGLVPLTHKVEPRQISASEFRQPAWVWRWN